MKIIYTMKKCNEKSEGFHSIFSVMNTFTVLHYEMYHSLQSLSTTHIQALDIQCTLWSPKYTPNDILDISKNYHLLLRYLYLPYTLHWYFFFWSCSHQEYLKVFWDLHSNHLLFFSLFPSLIWHLHEIAVNWHFSFSK